MDYEEAIPPSDTAFAVILSIICAFGLIGNVMVIFIVLVAKEYKKSVTNWYVLHLALADTLFLITIPLKVADKANGYWIHSTEACKANQGILFITYYASVMFLMVMSIDRYIAVCQSFSTAFQKLRKPFASFIVTLVVWTIAILISLPVLINATKRGYINCYCQVLFASKQVEEQTCNEHFDQYPDLDFDCNPRKCVSQEEHQQIIDYFTPPPTPEDGNTNYTISSNNSLVTTTNVDDITSGVGSPSFTTVASLLTSTYSDYTDSNSDDYYYEYSGGGTDAGVEDGCMRYDEPPVAYAHVWVNFIVMFLLPILVMSVCYGLITRRFHQTVAHATSTTVRSSQKGRDKDRRRVTMMCIALVAVFFVCWLLFHIVEITRLTSYFGLTSSGCEILVDTSFVFIYLNSALNPYLYSFLGTGFARKWQALKSSGLGKQIAAATSRSGAIQMSVRSKHFSQRGTKTSPLKQTRASSHSPLHESSASSNKPASEVSVEEKKSTE